MATVLLSYAGAALGTLLGGPVGGIVGRALGGLAGAAIDQELFGSHHEGPRLKSLEVMASQEGVAIPVVYGRMRIAGQVIWATNLLEVTGSQGGGKGGGGGATTTYSYFANFAVGLCEGVISGIGRCWADGKEIDLNEFSPRLYHGDELQQPDSLISSVEGALYAPAFRGVAYIVFERLPLAQFGNRIPQLSFEVMGKANGAAGLVKAVNIIPGATEFGYDAALVTRSGGPGVTLSENTHASALRSDWSVSIDQLQQQCANLGMASLVVSWFGNDLRCGQCSLMPGTDDAGKVTNGAQWVVSGITRSQARAVSRVNGSAAFGGTPSDGSVLSAIADLKARGLKVMFYPFVLMDIPPGNAMGQPAYPWRGRIIGDDLTVAAATQVATFMGAATATQFSAAGGTVSFSGSEWSYRRMILHYAKLCALAGGVDAFLIGSELRGLTTLRSARGVYPFVAALQQLAADVKAILPSAKVSYAADWSEYFGHQPSDGTGDVYFHLDPLWSSIHINFIGIDNYFPLTDWRDGQNHLDFLAGARSVYDQAYLQRGIASGENFDWYYATQTARDAQQRSPISDGAGKPWVFRAKDLKSWWSNPHFNRPAGVEATTATTWVPQSKPIWFTEIGCPAIDKGTNQPNLFVDAKSSESGMPYYSSGKPDVSLQLAFVQAVSTYWSTTGSGNPVSSLYAAPMVDAARMFFWAWDARPYPALPARSDVWGDAANYARGHWLNGRLATASLGELIQAIAARFGMTTVDTSGVIGLVDGFVLDRPMSARDALENLLKIFAIDCFESDAVIRFVSRSNLVASQLDSQTLIDDDKASALITQHRAQEVDLPQALHLAYVESDIDYRQAAVSAQRGTTSSKHEVSVSLSAGLTQAAAQARVDVVLAENWTARETAEFSLPPSLEAVEPGDVLALGGKLWRVNTIMAGTARKVQAVGFEPLVYDAAPAQARTQTPPAVPIYGQPEALLLDLAWADAKGAAAPRIAAQADPWPGGEALYKYSGAASLALNHLVQQPAVMGVSLTTLNAGLLDRIDYNQTLDIALHSGALSSVSNDQLLAGANLAALGSAATGYELFQFQNAQLIAADTYRLTGLLRAQFGSAPEMLPARAAGQNFVLLNGAIAQVELSDAEAALASNWKLGPQQKDVGSPSYLDLTYAGGTRPLRPLAPTYLQMRKDPAGFYLSWIRRTRQGGDSWEMVEVPLGEQAESYQLDILNGGTVVRSVTTSAPNYVYSSANIVADFGATPASLTVRVSQISSTVGQGAVLQGVLNA